jgi:hypothetical protein
MTKTKKRILWLCIAAACVLLIAGIAIWVIHSIHWGFSREISTAEQEKRLHFVTTAEKWLGLNDIDGSHKPIIDLYNAQKPLPQGYQVKYDDKWCATFVSATAIAGGLRDIIPMECGCERQIQLFMGLDAWEERDDYTPLPGDIIYYSGTDLGLGDCTGWSDHVGIVVGTWGGFMKVIEGNCGSKVAYRYIPINARTIRGFGLPNFSAT